MKSSGYHSALAHAVRAARAAGALIRRNLGADKVVNVTSRYDIKLELDERSQALIEKMLRRDFPRVAVLGEEGISGDKAADARWVLDPIDGTVNFAYGIPHACVSIALQVKKASPSAFAGLRRDKKSKVQSRKSGNSEYQTVIGVVYDPFCDELWTAVRGQPARLNGKAIHVSRRRRLADCIVTMGFSKSQGSLHRTLPFFEKLVPRVRKVRLTGAAALDLTYVASGRFDAFIERGVRLWDIAAGGLILECAGGEFWHEQIEGFETYRIIANNSFVRKKIQSLKRDFP
jgi:myo-inositol-1(or 4)-monophosphatase